MKTQVLIAAAVLFAASVMAADPKEEVKTAAKKLADAGGYSWHSEVEAGSASRMRPGPTDGKVGKDGVAFLKMTRGENTIEAVVKGEKGAIKTDAGWQSLAEATEASGDQQGNRSRWIARTLQNYQTPAIEAANLAEKVKELKKDGDAFVGDLTEDGVKALLTRGFRGGANAPEPANPKGSVKFWMKNGVLAKYEYKVQATMNWNNNDITIDRTTTVEIKDVGTTKVEIPEEAAKKLAS
ncbi:MAG TPA: hypothetical protein P5186_12200 [Candidatus Paceibacterota bacterium]|nr:hypothetical protein [Verrucomicrobiota bacterium]HRY48802.1 hypothetical protein [Candidatus Paceibacterota bacterium]HRZ99488.1 hypothetical protein [Candidatus Paceibacterota bacterium]